MRALRAYLTLLIAGVVLPGLLFGLGTSWWLAEEMRVRAEGEAGRLVEAVAGDIAEHVRLVITAMNVLARSPAVENGDLPEAYRFAALLSKDLGQHIGLATAEGRQLFNTREPLGTPLPRRASPASYRRALATGRPSVSDVIIGAIARSPLITIDLPVTSALGPMVLGTSTDVAAIAAIQARTQLAEGWRIAVIDGHGRFIARNVDPDRFVGELAGPELVAVAKASSPLGTLRHRSPEGHDLVSFFHKVAGTDWTVVIGIPEPVLLAPLAGPQMVLAATGAAAIGVTLAVALTMGWRLSRAARDLSRMAHALGHGAALPPSNRSIAEFEQVATMLHRAAAMIGDKQAELVAARDATEASAASKGRFFAAASHDLRQPLQASQLFLEALRTITEDPRQRRIIDQLDQAQSSMAELVGTLLDMARIDAGSLRPNLQPFDLRPLMEEIIGECRPLAEMKGVRLRLRCPEVRVVSDRMMLGRILRNLIHNAIRYTLAGGILVAGRARGGAVAIEVWDTGIGMAPDTLSLIWEEFYQIANSARDRAQGLGLGLAIVRRLATLLDCRVEVRSRPGRGSLFRVRLPE